MKETIYEYTLGEDIANSITHGIGALLAIGGLGVLTAYATSRGDAWHVVACSIFGATLILSYLTSTLYHGIRQPTARQVFRYLDHAAIFLLIAGTYTPFTLVTLRGPWGWWLFGIVWGFAIIGIVCETTVAKRMGILRVSTYVAMGWVVVVAARPMIERVEVGGLLLLLFGGLAYTGGIIFYAWKKLPYSHAIWHLFVLAGSTLHFFAVLMYVIPGRGQI